MNRVFIKLQPLDYFFFGGRRTFGDDNANYFVRSRHFPQQTAIVGLLRHLMLLKGLDKHKIGESFDAGKNEKQRFGPLLKLSPVFLYHNIDNQFSSDQVYLPHPLDAHETETSFFAESSNHAWKLNLSEPSSWGAATVLKGYEAKNLLLADLDTYVVNGQGKSFPKGQEKVFASTVRTGITKRHNHRTKANETERERGFYKQQVYKLTGNWTFGCFADFDDAFNPVVLDNTILPFGGERSLFRIQVQPVTNEWESVENQLSAKPFAATDSVVQRIILLSDAYLPETIYAETMTAVVQLVDFQNLHTPASANNYATLTELSDKQSNTMSKSGRFTLLVAGSVLYATANQTAKIKGKLEEAKHFRGIGYNHFIIR